MSGPVVVVDDHALVAGALVMALIQRGLDASAAVPSDFVSRIDDAAPTGGLVLLDLDLAPDLDGAALVPRLRRAGWRVLLVTGSTDTTRVAIAVAAGALGRVEKSAPFDDLVATVLRAAEGRSLIDDVERHRMGAVAAAARQDRNLAKDRWGRLTPRESQIVERLAAGRRPTVIAEEFVVSVATVRTQIRSILAKLEVGSQLEVAALARDRRHH